MLAAWGNNGACSDGTKGVWGGGYSDALGDVNRIEYITVASTGNSLDFGDLTVTRSAPSASANGTRGVFGGGSVALNVIDYITIASTGNATDFGDLTAGRRTTGACSGD